MSKTLYLDMDGVLVDFVAGALKIHHQYIPYEDITWNFFDKMELTPAQFYKPMGYDFWVGLEWTLEGQRLLEELESRYGENIVLLTAPVDTAGCDEGKRAWIRNNIPHFKRRTFIGQEKFRFAGPDKILLDDNDDNVNKFYENGGKSVLVPRPWNKRKPETDKGYFNVPDLIRVTEVQMA